MRCPVCKMIHRNMSTRKALCPWCVINMTEETNEPPVCSECKFPIPKWGKYYKHNNGTVLCQDCFNKLMKEGKIK